MTTLFDFLENDAAPVAAGARVNESNNQLDFNNSAVALRPPARRNAPPGTSSTAADRIAGHAPTLREQVYEYIVSCGLDGCTDEEGEAALGIRCQTYTPRRRELVQLGLVVDSDQRRPTSSGRPAAVWVAKRFADEAMSGGVA